MFSKRTILLFCLSIVILSLGFGIGLFVDKNSVKSTKKMIIINENLESDGNLFIPVSGSAYCVQLGALHALTDTKLQVFKIIGQDENSFLCLIKNGEEYLYQSQKEVPLTLSIFKPDKMFFCDFNTIDDKKIWVTEQTDIQKVLNDMNDRNVVEAPNIVYMIKQIVFTSTYFPGINLTFQYIQDQQGNCFITDTYSNITWKIGDELKSYIM